MSKPLTDSELDRLCKAYLEVDTERWDGDALVFAYRAVCECRGKLMEKPELASVSNALARVRDSIGRKLLRRMAIAA